MFKKKLNEFSLYFIITTLASVLDVTTFVLLSKFSVFENILNFIVAYFIAVITAFFLHLKFTFKIAFKKMYFLKYTLQILCVFLLNVLCYEISYNLIFDLYLSY